MDLVLGILIGMTSLFLIFYIWLLVATGGLKMALWEIKNFFRHISTRRRIYPRKIVIIISKPKRPSQFRIFINWVIQMAIAFRAGQRLNKDLAYLKSFNTAKEAAATVDDDL